MLCLARPLYPSDKALAALSAQLGVQSWPLEETFQPRRVSKSLSEPLTCLTPELKISGRQWLIQAPAAAKVSLQSGLLRLGGRCFYESNRANANPMVRRWRRAGSLPPGWWHRPRVPLRHPQPLLLLSTHNNPNYFHWLTQPGLAPLFLQEHFGLNPLPGATLALSHRPRRSLPSYVPSLLEVFSPEIPVIQGVALTSESLCRFALQEHSSDVVVSPRQLHWLHRRCRDQLQPPQKPWRRIMISRQRSTRRRCLNEDQLLASLAPYGFERHCLEDCSVIQQLRLFSESVVLVGAHGAGFSNLVVCAPQTSVVELIPRPGPFSHYYAMADVLGLSHGHVLASRCDLETNDFTIDPADLIALLREMELL